MARALVEQDRGQLAAAQASLAAARALTPGKGDQRLDRLAAAWGIQALRAQKDTKGQKPSTDEAKASEAKASEAKADEVKADEAKADEAKAD